MKTLQIYLTALVIILSFNLKLTADEKRIPVCKGTGNLFLPSSEKSNMHGKENGTIVCWVDERNNGSLYIQKMNVVMDMEWEDNGVMLDSGLGSGFSADSDYPQLFSDNEGGAVIIYRKIFYDREDVYMQKIYGNGERMENPVCLSSHYEGYNYSPSAALTKDNNIVVAWENFNNGEFDIHAQKISMDGIKLWNRGNEIIVCDAPADQRKPAIAVNDNNVVFMTWLDSRNHSDYAFDLFACMGDHEKYSEINGSEKMIFKNNMMSDSRKAIFYNHNVVSSEKNSFMVAAEKSDPDHGMSDIIIIKAINDLNHIQLLELNAGAYSYYPLIAKKNANDGASIVWNERLQNRNYLSAASIDNELNVLWSPKAGLEGPCEMTKNSGIKILPSDKIKNSLYTNNNRLFFTWVNSQTKKLYLTSLHLAGESGQCENTFEIQNEISEGECTSITYQRNSIVVVYKQSNNIFASVREISNDSLAPPEKITMIGNFPDPFNPSTRIFFNVPSDGFVSLNVFDISGKLVTTLVNEYRKTGKYNAIFDGSGLSSGAYFCRLAVNGMATAKRMMMIK